MLTSFTSAPGKIEQGKQFDPGDACNHNIDLCKCPFSSLDEAAHLLIKHLAMGESVSSSGGCYGFKFLVFNFNVAFIPNFRICFDPFERIESKESFGRAILFSFFLFRQG